MAPILNDWIKENFFHTLKLLTFEVEAACLYLAAIAWFSSFMTWTSCLQVFLKKKSHFYLWIEYTATWFFLRIGVEKEGTVKIWMGTVFLTFIHFFIVCWFLLVFFVMQKRVKTVFCETLCIQILPNRPSFSSLLLLLRAVLHSGQNLTTWTFWARLNELVHF